MKIIGFSVVIIILCCSFIIAQSIKSTEPQSNTEKKAVEPEKPIPWKDYNDAITKERTLLESDVNKHYKALDELYNKALNVFYGLLAAGGVILLVLLGGTWYEIKSNVKELTQSSLRSEIEKEVRKELDAERTPQKVIWVYPKDTNIADKEIESLREIGIENVERVSDMVGFKPDKTGLVIVSYDGSKEGSEKVKSIISKLTPPTFLVIYTYGYTSTKGAKGIMEDADIAILKDFDRYVPANFPGTLVSHANNLVRRGRT